MPRLWRRKSSGPEKHYNTRRRWTNVYLFIFWWEANVYFVPTYYFDLCLILCVLYIKKKKKQKSLSGFVESSDFFAWSMPIKVWRCRLWSHFFTLQSIYKLHKRKVFLSFHFGTSFEKNGMEILFYLCGLCSLWNSAKKRAVLCAKRVLVRPFVDS